MTPTEQPDFAHTHPEVYDMANGGGDTPIAEQPAIVGGVDAVNRYHFTDEQPFLVATDQGEQKLDSGWLAITEKEYAALTARPSAPAETDDKFLARVAGGDHDGPGGSRAPVEPGSEREALRAEIINTPETADFMAGVPIEAAHQRERWGSDHDGGKTPFDWFWLIGYLAQKAADAATRSDAEKARHHTISTAAALANWHAALTGADTSMRPGIDPPDILARPAADDAK